MGLVTHGLDDAPPRASAQFTDRVEFVEVYRSAIAAPPSDDKPRVIVYYGVGGVGKTALRRRLVSLTPNMNPNIITLVHDFGPTEHRVSHQTLQALRMQLVKSAGVSFPRFDAAYGVYWDKARSAEAKGSTSPLGSRAADYVADAVGILGVPGSLVLRALRDGAAALQAVSAMRSLDVLRRMPEMEPQQILDKMPAFWAADCRDHLSKHPAARLAIFLDTFEALLEGGQSEGSEESCDVWVRDLIGSLPQAHWVICGREKLRWGTFSSEWGECLDQHLVGELAVEDSLSFLESAGVAEATTRDCIAAASRGYPFYLDLACDLYFETLETRQPAPDDFGGSPREIYSRFTHYLQDPRRISELETLRLLSCSRRWTRDDFSALVVHFQTGFPESAFARLQRFSFITRVDETSFGIHDIMREALEASLLADDPKLFRRVHGWFWVRGDGILGELNRTDVAPEHVALFVDLTQHAEIVFEPADLVTWVTIRMRLFRSIRSSQELGRALGRLLPLSDEDACVEMLRAVAVYGSPAAIRSVLVCLSSSSGSVRAEAIFVLSVLCRGQLADNPDVSAATDRLIEALEGPDGYCAARALRVFEGYRTEDIPSEAMDELDRLRLFSQLGGVVGGTLRRLGAPDRGSDDRVRVAARRLLDDTRDDDALRLELELLLVELREQTSLSRLTYFLASEDPGVRLRALRALTESDTQIDYHYLTTALGDPTDQIRATAAETLGARGITCSIPSLLEMCGDESSMVRTRVARALGMLGDDRSVPALELLRDDACVDVRLTAVWALNRLNGHPASQL